MSPTSIASTRRYQAIVVQIAVAIEAEIVVATAEAAVAVLVAEAVDVVAVVAADTVEATVAMAATAEAAEDVASIANSPQRHGEHREDPKGQGAASNRGLF